MKISIIAAMSENRVIGSDGKIPWRLPADFKRFKELTMGHPVVMGRKTFESIGKPLPGRTNIVMTADVRYAANGCLVAHSLDDALALAREDIKVKGGGGDGASSDGAAVEGEIFVIGGEQIYELALPRAQTIYLTKVRGTFEGDAFFPEFDENEWKIVSSEEHQKDEKNPLDYTFLVYERK